MWLVDLTSGDLAPPEAPDDETSLVEFVRSSHGGSRVGPRTWSRHPWGAPFTDLETTRRDHDVKQKGELQNE
jgi:hypothetical protein